MINRINAFQVDDKTFATLQEAQAYELTEFIVAGGIPPDLSGRIAGHLIAGKDRVVDILTTGPRSKPKARKINGAKRTKPVKEVAA